MNIKYSLRVMVMEEASMVPKFFYLPYTDGETTFSPLSPYVYVLMPNMCHLSC